MKPYLLFCTIWVVGLSWDETLRARNGFPGIDFRRTQWPHGETGLAFGHAALFGGDALP